MINVSIFLETERKFKNNYAKVLKQLPMASVRKKNTQN